jgi:hypothetical protein
MRSSITLRFDSKFHPSQLFFPNVVRGIFAADGHWRHAFLFGFYTFARMVFLICLILASSRL